MPGQRGHQSLTGRCCGLHFAWIPTVRRVYLHVTGSLLPRYTHPKGCCGGLACSPMGATGDVLCSVTSMLAYLAIRPSTQGPLFVFSDGPSLSRPRLVHALRQALGLAGIDVSGVHWPQLQNWSDDDRGKGRFEQLPHTDTGTLEVISIHHVH